MVLLVLGLLLFLGVHSLRIAGDGPRVRLLGRIGETPYKIGYSVLSLIGLVLIGRGYRDALNASGFLWTPPAGAAHLALLLVPLAFVLLVAAYAPAGRIKYAVGHPMVLAVALWALAHLLANGETANVVLFGAFLAWALADYAASIRRDRHGGASRAALSARGDVVSVVFGLGVALLFIVWLHRVLIGVSPLG